ncbi:hypothetical protein EJ04DRAFT_215977 [Polyplosphaeria fusca]|uniref:Secreted protein n=1 Tax=Polyplosphaeria fusca TaxID=682080 RepID=A0A9P4QYX7_9PLEO|nr:hypothetical protein EJ04DRAFT_215977 [Polyplosphaeria fusca]
MQLSAQRSVSCAAKATVLFFLCDSMLVVGDGCRSSDLQRGKRGKIRLGGGSVFKRASERGNGKRGLRVGVSLSWTGEKNNKASTHTRARKSHGRGSQLGGRMAGLARLMFSWPGNPFFLVDELLCFRLVGFVRFLHLRSRDGCASSEITARVPTPHTHATVETRS